MKPPCLKVAVYRTLYPHPKENDPASFSEFVNRCIVPEVRTETVRFYGPIDDLEAKYPGLDYSSSAHRLRLRHFPNHCRLFDAFDRLQLTSSEIYELCKWEGTKNAKDKYMKHNRVHIHDSTFDGMRRDDRPRLPPTSYRSVYHRPRWQDPCSRRIDACSGGLDGYESPDDAVASGFGFSLNQRVREATAAELRGQQLPLDPFYEQWMKDANEQGTIGLFREIPPLTVSPTGPMAISPPYMPLAPVPSYHPPPPSQLGRHRRHSTLPAGQYERSHYWTRTVPEMIQYAPRVSPAPGRWGQYVDAQFPSRRLPLAPPLVPASSPMNARLYHAPGWMGTPPAEFRRSRRR